MGGFLSFVKKEALHIVRDPRTMLIVLLMPVVQVLLFGFAMNTEVTDIEVAVVAPHPTEAVRRAVERIAANPYFTFRGCIAATEINPCGSCTGRCAGATPTPWWSSPKTTTGGRRR